MSTYYFSFSFRYNNNLEHTVTLLIYQQTLPSPHFFGPMPPVDKPLAMDPIKTISTTFPGTEWNPCDLRFPWDFLSVLIREHGRGDRFFSLSFFIIPCFPRTRTGMSLELGSIKYDNTFGALLVGGLCAIGCVILSSCWMIVNRNAVDFMVSLVHKSTIFLSGGFKTLYLSNGRCVYHERHRDTLTMFTRVDLIPLVCSHLPAYHAHFSYRL